MSYLSFVFQVDRQTEENERPDLEGPSRCRARILYLLYFSH